MTKIKFSKNEESGALFIERRRANLERFVYNFFYPSSSFILFFRFLNRLAIHPVIRKAEEFKTFLENPGEVRHSPPRGFV